MGAYIGANERFGSGEPNHQRGFEHVISYSAALESAYREIAELKDKLAQEKLYLEDEIRGEMDFDGIVGQSSALRHVLNLVETVAPSDSTVLLLGETGTGKELIAKAIHARSRRRDRTLVKVNCAALPPTLIEGELFRHPEGRRACDRRLEPQSRRGRPRGHLPPGPLLSAPGLPHRAAAAPGAQGRRPAAR